MIKLMTVSFYYWQNILISKPFSSELLEHIGEMDLLGPTYIYSDKLKMFLQPHNCVLTVIKGIQCKYSFLRFRQHSFYGIPKLQNILAGGRWGINILMIITLVR